MGLLGVALVWGGYAVFVYGLELVRGKCTPLKRIMWPAGATSGDVSVTCPQASTDTVAKLNQQGQGQTQQVTTAQTPSGPLTFGIGSAR